MHEYIRAKQVYMCMTKCHVSPARCTQPWARHRGEGIDLIPYLHRGSKPDRRGEMYSRTMQVREGHLGGLVS